MAGIFEEEEEVEGGGMEEVDVARVEGKADDWSEVVAEDDVEVVDDDEDKDDDKVDAERGFDRDEVGRVEALRAMNRVSDRSMADRDEEEVS